MKKLDPKVKTMTIEQKKKLLIGELGLINKKYGKEVLTFGYNREQNRIPFASEELNSISSGGAPCGKFTVIWGSKGSCKTTNCYGLVANAQKMGKICVWVDFERSFNKDWARKQGVDVESLVMAPAFENAEVAMDTVISLIKTKAVDLVIIDSIQGMSPIGEQEVKKSKKQKSLADDTMALLAKKLSQFFRMSSGQVWETDCTIVLIGQTRTDLGGFIALEKLSGGNALEHWSSLTIHVRRGAKKDWPSIKVPGEKEGEDKKTVYTGFNMIARIDKSKVGPDEAKECSIEFKYGTGIVNDMNVKDNPDVFKTEEEVDNEINESEEEEEDMENNKIEPEVTKTEETIPTQPKKKRGRPPRKVQPNEETIKKEDSN